MKKVLIVIVVIVAVAGLGVWVASWFRADEEVAASAARTWPGDLGPLEAVGKRLKPVHASAASRRLAAFSRALPENDVVEGFVSREISSGALAIGAPPALPDVTAMRELVLGQRVSWKRHEGIDHEETMSMRGVQMTVARALLASALVRARANDPAAWEDLRATWKLTRVLDDHPQMMAQTAALSMARMINAIAWKLPLPAPAWFREVQERDNVRPVLEAFQYQASSYWADGAQMFPTKLLADSVEHDRAIAEQVFKLTACDVTLPMNDLGVDVRSVWRRAFRYRAEREATANALRARDGKPIQTTSQCSDGTWSFDGATLRFSREIATEAPDKPMPLVLQVSVEGGRGAHAN